MAIVYFSYLFDALDFHKTMMPLISELEEGNYQSLYQLAKQTMEAKPELWPLLNSLSLGPPFDEENEEPSPSKWLMMIMAQFLQPIAEFGVAGGWAFIKQGLPLIGWSEEDTKLLLFGRSLCTLLIPHKQYEVKEYVNHPQDIPWCVGYATWLDLITIERLRQQLIQSREAYIRLSERPEIIQNKIYLKDDVRVTRDWYSNGLLRDYSNIMKILTTAHEAQKSLAIAIV